MHKPANLIYPFYLMTLFAALAGCAGPAPDSGKPDWISGNSDAWPAEQYLIGRGEAGHAAVARDRARADLAKVFEVAISEQSQDITEYSRSGNGNHAEATLEASASRQIATRTEQTLSHIEIAEVWQDPDTGRQHALAVLDRLKAGQQLRDAIRQLDNLTASAIERARQQDELLRQLGQATHAVEAQLQRRALQQQLQVIDLAGVGEPERYALSQLLQDRMDLAQRIRIRTNIEQDSSGRLATLINGALADAGFQHVNDNANYQLDARLEMTPFTDQNWHWVHGTLTIVLSSLSDNTVQGSHRWEIKQAASRVSLARQRALDNLGSRLNTELRQIITGFSETQ